MNVLFLSKLSLPGKESHRVQRMSILLSLVLDRRDIVAGAHPSLFAGSR